MKEIKLYFGLKDQGGNYILLKDFNNFLSKFVIPTFPSFNITNGVGVWKGENEPCTIVSIITEDLANFRNDVANICKFYCMEFDQESVLVTFNKIEEYHFYGK